MPIFREVAGHPSGPRASSGGRIGLSGRCGRLVDDRRAATAIEFAFLLPLFFGIVMVIGQVGLYFYFSTSLTYAANEAMRQVMTGAVAKQSLTAAQFRNQVLCPLLPGAMSCSNIITNIQVVPKTNVNQNYWYNFVNSDRSWLTAPTMDNNKTAFCIGSPGAIVAAQIYYAMPVLGITQMLSNAGTYGGQSVVFLGATVVLKNEPFIAATTPAC